MAQTGYTPILIYGSGTASAVPTAGNLTSSANGAELALNYTDGKLYYKDNSGTVRLLTDKISVSVASANGFAGTVAQATATSTPAITLTTSVNGIIYGNGTAMQAVTIGSGISFAGGTLSSTGSGGTVTSVALSVPAFLSVAGSPITGSGTLAVSYSGTALPVANGGTGQTSYTNGQLLIGNTAGNTLTKATLTAGSGVSITNGAGSITIAATGSGGTVTSVAMSVPAFLSVAGSPITSSGTLAVSLSGTALPVANGGTGATTLTANNVILGNGTSAVQFVAPGSSGNVLTSNGTTWASSAPSGGSSFSVKTANYTAVSGDNIFANTSGGSFTITLPASPSTGASISIADAVGSFQAFPLQIARNGSTIMSLSEDMFASINGASINLAFNGSTWRLI